MIFKESINHKWKIMLIMKIISLFSKVTISHYDVHAVRWLLSQNNIHYFLMILLCKPSQSLLVLSHFSCYIEVIQNRRTNILFSGIQRENYILSQSIFTVEFSMEMFIILFKKNILKVAEFPQPVPDSSFSVSNTSWGWWQSDDVLGPCITRVTVL